MANPAEFTWNQALDPTTPAATLAEIAAHRPDLRAAVAANPSTYPQLLEWLGGLGDPSVNAALSARTSPRPQHKVRNRVIGIAAGIVVLLAIGGGLAWGLVFSKLGGAATPEDAATKLVNAVAAKDFVSMYGAISPAEANLLRTIGESGQKLAEGEKNQKSADSAQAALDAIAIKVTGMTTRTEQIDTGLAKVYYTAGQATVSADAEKLVPAIGDLYDQLASTAGTSGGTTANRAEVEKELREGLRDNFPYTLDVQDMKVPTYRGDEYAEDYPYVMLVEEGGRWYVSPMMTLGEYGSGGRDRGSMPSEAAEKYSRPEQAAQAVMDGLPNAARGRFNGLLDALSTPERRFGYVYGRGAEDSLREYPAELTVRSKSFSVISKKGDTARLAIDDASIDIRTDSEDSATLSLDGTCFRYTIPDTMGQDGCLTDVELFNQLGARDLALVAVKESGSWRMSLLATVADASSVVASNLERLQKDGQLSSESWWREMMDPANWGNLGQTFGYSSPYGE